MSQNKNAVKLYSWFRSLSRPRSDAPLADLLGWGRAQTPHCGIRCLTLYLDVSLYWVMGLSAIPHVPTPTFPFTLSGEANILRFTWEEKKNKNQKEGGQRIIEKKCNMEDYWSVKLDTLSLCYLLAPSCSLNKLYCWTAAIWISGPLSLVPALSSSALSSVPFSSCIPFALPAAPSWKGSTIRHPITDMTITQICGHTNQTVCTFRSLIWENQMRRWLEKKLTRHDEETLRGTRFFLLLNTDFKKYNNVPKTQQQHHTEQNTLWNCLYTDHWRTLTWTWVCFLPLCCSWPAQLLWACAEAPPRHCHSRWRWWQPCRSRCRSPLSLPHTACKAQSTVSRWVQAYETTHSQQYKTHSLNMV